MHTWKYHEVCTATALICNDLHMASCLNVFDMSAHRNFLSQQRAGPSNQHK